MKKLVTLLLVAVLVLGLGSTAFAATFSDVNDLGTDAKAAIAKLDALNVIGGYPDGTFKPAGNITRAEFAKIAVQLAGMGSTQEGLKNSASQFADVKTGMWYTGWINLATSQGFLMGYPDGTFRPDAKITYEEVVTILLRIVGYDSNLPGPWPTEYIAKAAGLGITDDITFTVGSFATRADVAMMAKELLDQYMVTWLADSQNFVSNFDLVAVDQDEDEYGVTLLEYSFKGFVKEDYVVTDWAKDDDGFSIEVVEYDEDWDWGDEGDVYDLTDDAVLLGANTVPGLGGFIVDYIEEDGDIAYVEVTSTCLYSDDVEVNDDDEVVVDDQNYEQADNLSLDENDIDNGDFYDIYLTEDGEVYDYYNETVAVADGEYDVRLVDANKGTKLTFKANHGESGSLADLDTKDILVVKDGKYAELKDITENDVLYVDDEGNGALDLYLKAYTISASGTLDAEYSDDNFVNGKWKIGGTKYVVNDQAEVSRDNGDEFDAYDPDDESILDGVFDETVKYYLNYANQVEFLIANVEEDADVVYGVVNDIVDTTSKDYVTRIEVLKADGSMQKYDIDTDEVEILDTTGIDDQLDEYQLIRFSVNDAGDIDDLTILAVTDGDGVTAATAEVTDDNDLDDFTDDDYDVYASEVYDADSDKNKVAIINGDNDDLYKYTNDDTVVFNLFPGTDDGDDVVITDAEDFLEWAEDYDGLVYVQYDGSKIEYVAICDANLPGTSYKYAAITEKSYRSGDDRKVTIDNRGTEKTYVQADEDEIYRVGEVYEYYLDGSDFTDETLIFDASDLTVGQMTYRVWTVDDIDVENETIELYIDENHDGRVNGDENIISWNTTEDSVIYDFSDWYDDGSDPVWSELADFEADDLVMIGFESEEAWDDGEVTFLFKVNNMDEDDADSINATNLLN